MSKIEARTFGGVEFQRHIWYDGDDDPVGLKDVAYDFQQYVFDRQEESTSSKGAWL